jgi:hypothetical protein
VRLQKWLMLAMILAAGLTMAPAADTTALAASVCKNGYTLVDEMGCTQKSMVRAAKKLCMSLGRKMADCLCDEGEIVACRPKKTAPKCKEGTTFVTLFGCVNDKEISKARKICAKLPKASDFTDCLCQDGKSIGACGD